MIVSRSEGLDASGGSPAVPASRLQRAASGEAPILNAMTVDVEDYFQVEAFSKVVSRDAWETLPRRVEENTDRLLALFGDAGVKATFFVLGWIATRHGPLIRRIVQGGHELASHGFSHVRADRQNPDEFRSDVCDTRRLLEDIGGVAVVGYRAATFSIGRDNWWAYDVLAEEGYAYSSSVFPISHDLYGAPDAPRQPFHPLGGQFIEIPLTTVRIFGRNFPCSGGGYFRLLPYSVSQWGFSRIIEREGRPCVFYCHPWEIDPAQPRQTQAPLKSRLRHYLHLSKMEHRIGRLLRDFSWGRMDEVFLGASTRDDGTHQKG